MNREGRAIKRQLVDVNVLFALVWPQSILGDMVSNLAPALHIL